MLANKVLICLLRGPPGSGKTTFANGIINFFGREKLDNGQVMYISRDDIRENYAKRHGMSYVDTFKDVNANTRIRDKFMHEIEFCVNDWYFRDIPNRVVIIDSTFSKLADMKNIFKICKLSKLRNRPVYRNRVRVFNFNTVRRNHRNVPNVKLLEIKKNLNETDEYLKEHVKKSEIVEIN